jgi:hypothetical protein
MTLEISSQKGILPISEKYHIEFNGWMLPGHGSSYLDCGSLRFRGCLNVNEHNSLDFKRNHKAFVQGYYRSCARKECPVCYESWAGLEAERASYRLLNYAVSKSLVRELYSIKDLDKRSRFVDHAFRSAKRKVIHVIFSIPEDSYDKKISVLRVQLYKLAKKSGLFGGCVIFHPFRNKTKGKNEWFFSPHFHILGFGWIRNTKLIYEQSGWIIKNAGVRKSVHNTLMYQLSHAGVHKDYHVVTWFGSLSYNKLKIDSIPEFKPVCPLCKSELEGLVFCGSLDRPPPDKEGDYFLDVEDWKGFNR